MFDERKDNWCRPGTAHGRFRSATLALVMPLLVASCAWRECARGCGHVAADGGFPHSEKPSMPNPDGACSTRSCSDQAANCGPVADGCGGLQQCGTCVAPETCGGGGTPSVCGNPAGACVLLTCKQLGFDCGPAADGCGGLLDCGNCTEPQTCGGGGQPSVCGGAGLGVPAFPLEVSSNGRYLVDQSGVPFRIHGEASWDAHINLASTDLKKYLADRRRKGFNALFTYVANSVAYVDGSSAPWAVQLGGAAAGVAALPFSKNAAGNPWDGDPNFTNHDANFAYPNDSYFAWVAEFVDEAAAHGMVVLLAPMYLGYNSGATDGWYSTLLNSANTRTVCYEFGKYLADGHGMFTGFRNRPNIVWVAGGDALPGNGSEAALRSLQVFRGMRDAGDTHFITTHWQHDYLCKDQKDFAAEIKIYAAYTHGPYPVQGPTYAETRELFADPQPRPTFLLETNYWGGSGASAAVLRYLSWGAALSGIGGATFGFSPLWNFAVSRDGVAHSSSGGGTTAWLPSTDYALNTYVSSQGNWYRAVREGKSGNAAPSGTGLDIADGSVTWAYISTGGWEGLLNQPAVIDFQRMGTFLNSLRWYDLVPSGLAGMRTLVTSGGGSYTQWSSGNPSVGGMDWIVAAATRDGTHLVAYVPDAHTGSFSVDLAGLSGKSRARWYDPTSGAWTSDPSGRNYDLSNTSTHTFAIPGYNSGGKRDWVLSIDVAAATESSAP